MTRITDNWLTNPATQAVCQMCKSTPVPTAGLACPSGLQHGFRRKRSYGYDRGSKAAQQTTCSAPYLAPFMNSPG